MQVLGSSKVKLHFPAKPKMPTPPLISIFSQLQRDCEPKALINLSESRIHCVRDKAETDFLATFWNICSIVKQE
jgi:hypothetical protein